MHVLILPSWYFPFGTQAIAGRMFHQLAASLRQQEIDARVYYARYSPREPFFQQSVESTEEGVPTWRSRQFFPPRWTPFIHRWWRRKYATGLRRYMQKQGRPDLIHAHSYMAAYVAAGLKEQDGIPFIFTERLSSFITGSIPESHTALLEEVFDQADEVTCVSPGMQHCMAQYTQRNIEVVPNFFDEHIFHTDPDRKKHSKFTFVSIGEPAHTKGLDILLQAYAGLKGRAQDQPMQLTLVDEIPEKEQLMALAKSLHIEEDINWKGLMPRDALAQELQESHVLVSASRVESFGKTIIEGLACGLPVVATETDGAKYILDIPLMGEFAATGDAASLSQAMEQVMSRYASFNADELSAAIGKRFGQQKVIDQWIGVYNTLAT